MIDTQASPTSDGAIVRDASIAGVDERWFDADWWDARGAVERQSGGRGGIVFVTTPAGQAALRHYRRGGLVARIRDDRYLWTGAIRTRAFSEFLLLATLHDWGLPVPRPMAARYRRHGFSYSADLLTLRIADARTLAQRIVAGDVDAGLAAAIGATLARFHQRGVCHADLNVHNVLVDADGKVWLLDFDRGRLCAPMRSWQQANLTRLRRSIGKVAGDRDADIDGRFWHPLLARYHAALGTAS